MLASLEEVARGDGRAVQSTEVRDKEVRRAAATTENAQLSAQCRSCRSSCFSAFVLQELEISSVSNRVEPMLCQRHRTKPEDPQR